MQLKPHFNALKVLIFECFTSHSRQTASVQTSSSYLQGENKSAALQHHYLLISCVISICPLLSSLPPTRSLSICFMPKIFICLGIFPHSFTEKAARGENIQELFAEPASLQRPEDGQTASSNRESNNHSRSPSYNRATTLKQVGEAGG